MTRKIQEKPKKKIQVIEHAGEKKSKAEKKVRRVAAYCRVSTLADEQELSYESQCRYFQEMIESREDMELVGVYGDHGISGVNAEKRSELQRMLQDARDGKIDLILVKSISRLSRNVIDMQNIVNEMNALGIRIEFEKENLKSDDPAMEMIMKFMSNVAQQEVNSLSQAVRWAYDKNASLGQPTRSCAYGYRKKPRKRGEPHVWEIFEPEAALIRLAYDMLLKGAPYRVIGRAIVAEQKKNPEIKQKRWDACRVKAALTNVVYQGDILTHKSFTTDYLSKKSVQNNGEKDQYYIEDHHPAIVSREIFAEAGRIIDLRNRGLEE